MGMIDHRGGCEPEGLGSGFHSVAYPALVRCTSPVCPLPVMTLPEVADAAHWVRVHYLSGCQMQRVELRSQAEAEAEVRRRMAAGEIWHWELYFDATQQLVVGDVYTGAPLRPLQFMVKALPVGDRRGAWHVVVPGVTMGIAERQARELLRRAIAVANERPGPGGAGR